MIMMVTIKSNEELLTFYKKKPRSINVNFIVSQMCVCVCILNEERKRRDKEKRRNKIAYILRAYLSLFFSSLSLSLSVTLCSKCIYTCVLVCVYVKETTTSKEAQQCLRGRARLNDK